MENAINQEQILDWYMDDVLEYKNLNNVYQFTKAHDMSESEFYQYFSNLDKIEAYFFELLIGKTVDTLNNAEEYVSYSPQEKLLSFYYTFFGNLTANRSFALHTLKNHDLKSLKKLNGLRKAFIAYFKTLDFNTVDLKSKNLNQMQETAQAEAAWIQLLAAVAYWRNDSSPQFEKTDVFIEKSLSTTFEVLNNQVMNKVADFAKFLFQEINPRKA